MTGTAEEAKVVKKIVIAFDICSFSNILEDLSLTHNVSSIRNLLIAIKDLLMDRVEMGEFYAYQFTGDGWILLFPEDTPGKYLMNFLTELSLFFKKEVNRRVVPLLERTPEIMGITFGMDMGELVKIVMMGRREYIGRAINIACRLQSAIKDRDSHPEYKALVSNHVFKKLSSNDMAQYKPKHVTRKLRNIRDGEEYRCVKLILPVAR
jgi:class 3 adenylate cyclase